MFREMRRKNQALSLEECIKKQLLDYRKSVDILNRGTAGVLALLGDNDYPYTVPISYVYDNSKIYFHSAKAGHKIDAIRKNRKASFCVLDQDQVIPEEYTTYFRSVIAFGQIRILEKESEIQEAMEKLAFKYYPEDS